MLLPNERSQREIKLERPIFTGLMKRVLIEDRMRARNRCNKPSLLGNTLKGPFLMFSILIFTLSISLF